MSKWFNVYLMTGLFSGIYLEILNYEKISGLGLIAFLLTMILYYSFPKEVKNEYSNRYSKKTKS